LRDVPEATRATLKFVFLETVDDAIQASLGQRGASRTTSEFKLI
jgi:ATP-dependent Lon protease